MKLPSGARFYDLTSHEDKRGSLTAFDDVTNMPFEARRFFFIKMPSPGIPRAEHACSSEQMIVVLHGMVSIDIDDGFHQATIELHSDRQALWLKPGLWIRMTGNTSNTVLLVLASELFSETKYYASARSGIMNK
ncbi:FdtA/QdtA family cupin domain-containing protein [Methylobacterium sp. WL9]|uniref:sugar 3,4-ketoisomerase n=1 Tax=Methylobacterium sp. WL9 TaxID=2603898 RepID=UPI00164F1FB2|nr:FdtA/QdtA family cupin domain-containing protein [Methylobacterium sp. WL9]